MAANPSGMLTELFARLGFKIDDSGLKLFESKLKEVERGIKNIGAAAAPAQQSIRKIAKEAEESASKVLNSEKRKQAEINKAWAERSRQMKEESAKLKEVDKAYKQRQDEIQRTGRMQAAAMEEDARRTRYMAVQHDRALRMDQMMEARKQAQIQRMGRLQAAAEREAQLRAQRAAAAQQRQQIREMREQTAFSKKYAPLAYAKQTLQADLASLELRRATMGAAAYKEALVGIQDRLKNIGNQARGLQTGGRGGFGILGFGGLLAATTAATGMAFGISALSHELQETQAQKFMFQAAFGGEKEGLAEQKKYREFADKLGINYAKNAKGYASFMATGKETVGYQSAFEGYKAFTEYGSVAGVRGPEYTRMMLALQQILGKGKFQAEEVNRQLVNAAPALRPIIAQAITGKTGQDAFVEFDKMMKSGQATTAKYWDKVVKAVASKAREGGALAGAQKDLTSQIARLENARRDLMETLDKKGFVDYLAKGVEFVANKVKDLNTWLNESTGEVNALASVFKVVGDTIGFLVDILFSRFGLTLGIVSGISVIFLNWGRILAGIVAIFTPFRLAILAVALAAEDIWVWLIGGQSVLGEIIGPVTEYKDALKTAANWAETAFNFLKSTLGLMIEMGDKMKNVFPNMIDYMPTNPLGGIFGGTIKNAMLNWGGDFGGIPNQGFGVAGLGGVYGMSDNFNSNYTPKANQSVVINNNVHAPGNSNAKEIASQTGDATKRALDAAAKGPR